MTREEALKLPKEELLNVKVSEVKNYNYDSPEKLEEATIILGSPTGIISFNQTPHKWAYQIYKNMIDRTWVASQVNTTKDRANYGVLPKEKKRMMDLVLAQLITNDSVQSTQLPRIASYISSPVVAATLTRQALEEVIHSESYSVMAEDVCADTERIYNLYKENAELYLKNKAVGDMYASIYKEDKDLTVKDLLMIMIANQILEELVFPGGFVAMYSLEEDLPGTAEMITEINKDETLSHVPLFKNIFRTALAEFFNNEVPKVIEEEAHIIIKRMTEAEIRWTKYVTSGLLGFSDRSIESFVQGQANSVCSNLKLPLLYPDLPDRKDNPLYILIRNHIPEVDGDKIRSAMFTGNSTQYSKSMTNDL